MLFNTSGQVLIKALPRHSKKVLKRSPDHLNNGKIDQGSTTAYNDTYFVLPYMEVAAILVK